MVRPTRKRDPFRDAQTTQVTVVEQAHVDLYYDYDQVPEAYRESVRRAALNIKPRLKRAAEDIFAIGQELHGVKEKLAHGQYTNWLDVEFGLSERMAQRFMSVSGRLGAKSDKLSVLPPSTLYLLAAPSTPDTAIKMIEEEISAGRRIGVAFVQEVIHDAKQHLKDIPPSEAVVDGEVITPEIDEEMEAERVAVAERLDKLLSQIFDMLSGQPAEDWGILFRNSELTRVRNEIYQLRAELQKNILKPQ